MGYIHAQPETFVNSTDNVLAHLVLQTQSECEAGPALEVLWLLPKAVGFSSALRLRSSRGDVAPRQNPTPSPGEPLILGNSEPETDNLVLCTPAWRAAQGHGRTRESQSMRGTARSLLGVHQWVLATLCSVGRRARTRSGRQVQDHCSGRHGEDCQFR